MAKLILIRHGESRWNLANKFTGQVDVPLSEHGIIEAEATAVQLKNTPIDLAFTSRLTRAQETLLIILSEQQKTGIFLHNHGKMKKWSHHKKDLDDDEILIYHSEDLNERYYGDLQGMNKDRAREDFGEKQVQLWRRGYSDKPPHAESLKDVFKRSTKYYKKKILPELQAGKNVIVAAHGNSLRSLIKYIENISDEDIPNLELQTGKAIIYEYDNGNYNKENNEKHSFNRPMK